MNEKKKDKVLKFMDKHKVKLAYSAGAIVGITCTAIAYSVQQKRLIESMSKDLAIMIANGNLKFTQHELDTKCHKSLRDAYMILSPDFNK